MGWRFQRRISILPGVRINIGKSGVSTSVGPKGADINIGRHGVTTNAGIPGTGLSYRQRLGKPGTMLGLVLLGAALLFGVLRQVGTQTEPAAPPPASTVAAMPAAPVASAAAPAAVATRYVRRAGSVLRARPSTSAPALAREPKGAEITLLATDGAWSQVSDGTQEGWMRSSLLAPSPPKRR